MNLQLLLSQFLIALALSAIVLVVWRIKRRKLAGDLFAHCAQLRREIDLSRCRADVDPLMVERFAIESKAPDFLSVYEKAEREDCKHIK